MHDLKTIEEHILIRETVGYSLLDKIDVVDMPKFLEFLKITKNYLDMKKLSGKFTEN